MFRDEPALGGRGCEHGLLGGDAEVDSSGSMKDVALSGHACTLLPLMAVKEELARGTLDATRVVKPAIRRTTVLAVTRSGHFRAHPCAPAPLGPSSDALRTQLA